MIQPTLLIESPFCVNHHVSPCLQVESPFCQVKSTPVAAEIAGESSILPSSITLFVGRIPILLRELPVDGEIQKHLGKAPTLPLPDESSPEPGAAWQPASPGSNLG